jgi:hypothetical protein
MEKEGGKYPRKMGKTYGNWFNTSLDCCQQCQNIPQTSEENQNKLEKGFALQGG